MKRISFTFAGNYFWETNKRAIIPDWELVLSYLGSIHIYYYTEGNPIKSNLVLKDYNNPKLYDSVLTQFRLNYLLLWSKLR